MVPPPWVSSSLNTESQNVRGWKGPLWVKQSNPPAEAGLPTAGCTGPCPDLVQADLDVPSGLNKSCFDFHAFYVFICCILEIVIKIMLLV